jgi:hypothetical protein
LNGELSVNAGVALKGTDPEKIPVKLKESVSVCSLLTLNDSLAENSWLPL